MRDLPSNPPLPHSTSSTPHGDAIARWVAALNARGQVDAVTAAVEPNARVERQGIGALREEVVETIEGVANIGRWMALSPGGTTFTVGGAETPTAGLATVRYAIEVAGFHNGGAWAFKLGEAGKIAWLRHQPDSLSDASVGEVRDPSESWRKYVVDVPVHNHQHDHHDHDSDGGHDQHDH